MNIGKYVNNGKHLYAVVVYESVIMPKAVEESVENAEFTVKLGIKSMQTKDTLLRLNMKSYFLTLSHAYR